MAGVFNVKKMPWISIAIIYALILYYVLVAGLTDGFVYTDGMLLVLRSIAPLLIFSVYYKQTSGKNKNDKYAGFNCFETIVLIIAGLISILPAYIIFYVVYSSIYMGYIYELTSVYLVIIVMTFFYLAIAVLVSSITKRVSLSVVIPVIYSYNSLSGAGGLMGKISYGGIPCDLSPEYFTMLGVFAMAAVIIGVVNLGVKKYFTGKENSR